jgi:hypothetical protein
MPALRRLACAQAFAQVATRRRYTPWESTPHPAQGLRVFVRAKGVFENKRFTAWHSCSGTNGLPRSCPLRAVALDPPRERVADFELSMWGSTFLRGHGAGRPQTLQRLGRMIAPKHH